MMQNPAYRHDTEALLATCAEQNVGVQTIKSIARGRWEPNADARRFSWYNPLVDEAAIARAVRYVLSDERVFLNTSSDARLLDPALTAAVGDLTRPSDSEMEADVVEQGMTPLFDGAELERI